MGNFNGILVYLTSPFLQVQPMKKIIFLVLIAGSWLMESQTLHSLSQAIKIESSLSANGKPSYFAAIWRNRISISSVN
jgi:hypothetical protein